MFDLLKLVGTTAIFERTYAKTFDPIAGWFKLQGYNAAFKTVDHSPSAYAKRVLNRLRNVAPASVRRAIKPFLRF
jgi:hypothetical protein